MRGDELSIADADPDPRGAGLPRPSLLGRTQEELEALLVARGEAAFRGRQLFSGLYRRRAATLDGLTDLPRALRTDLAEHYDIGRPKLDGVQVSKDGTRKYRFGGAGGEAFEAVYIPEVARGRRTNTLCISSQTGCALGCAFCFTASLKKNRNLGAAEILGQVLVAGDDVAPLGKGARISNIVFMGMGEPLLNYDNVVRAARLLTRAEGMDFSKRRVTISTAGIVSRIRDLGRDLDTQLAISLNATTDALRDRIMPINRKWPLAELMAALADYPLPPRRRITIEYVLLAGTNDADADARRLVRLLSGLKVKVNLLPLNPHPRTQLQPPSPARVAQFQAILLERGMNAIIRTPRGRDIDAACGQLGEANAGASARPCP